MAQLKDLPTEIHLQITRCLLDNYRDCEDLPTLLVRYQPGSYSWTHDYILALSEVSAYWRGLVRTTVKDAQQAIEPDLNRLSNAWFQQVLDFVRPDRPFRPLKNPSETYQAIRLMKNYHSILLGQITDVEEGRFRVDYKHW